MTSHFGTSGDSRNQIPSAKYNFPTMGNELKTYHLQSHFDSEHEYLRDTVLRYHGTRFGLI